MTRMTLKNDFARKACTEIRRLLNEFVAGRRDGIRGVAAIEFAATATALVVMMIGTADFGMGFYRKMQVQNAAQAGARYAMMHQFDSSSISSIGQAVTSATAFTGTVPYPAPLQFDGCPSNTGVTNPDINSKCPDGSTAGTYVTVSAQNVYHTVLPFPLLGIPDSFTFTAQSTVRIK
jgi:Flp pilus assembly protein TadG